MAEFIVKKKPKKWLGRSLENFKKEKRSLAEEKGVLDKFLSASTLTEAKKILKGIRV